MTQPPLAYPHPAGHHLNRPPNSDLHMTTGLANNWALDFMAPGGTPFLCPQDSMILRLSGHNPALGEVAPSIFGWNMYLVTSGGVIYFATHLGDRAAGEALREHRVGDHVKRGDLLGHVGHWPNDPPRSHTHLGITHPAGKVAAVARIEAVAQATMLPFPPL